MITEVMPVQIVRQNQYLQYAMDLAAMTKESVLKCAKKFFLSLRNGFCACFALAAMISMLMTWF